MTKKVADYIYDPIPRYLVEDEFFTAIENRDKKIAELDKRIAEQERRIAEQNQQLAELNRQEIKISPHIAEQDQQIAEHLKALRSTVQGLAARGMSIDDIAMLMGKTKDEIGRIIAE